MEQTKQTVAIPMDELLIQEEGFNSRRERITPFSVKNLQQDMAENGLDQPIHVKTLHGHPTKKYKVIAGFRRTFSARELGWKTIPAFVRDDLSDEQAERIFNIRENMQRRDLSLIDQAYAIKPFLAKYASAQWIAEKLNLSKRWINYLIMVGKLDDSIQKEIEANPSYFKQGHIERMVDMKLPDAQKYVHDIKAHASRGENLKIRKPKMTRLSDKSRRTVQEINDLLEAVYDALDPGIETRLLAWAAGNISNIDIIRDLIAIANDRDRTFIPPESFGMV
jgi:ParB/RepB/Spo0J family partition protein